VRDRKNDESSSTVRERRLLERVSYWERGPDRSNQTPAETLVRSICAHLLRLLNTRQGSVPLDPLFGVPDLTNIAGGLSSGATADIEQELRRVVGQYEPRLKNPSVSATQQSGDILALAFSLSGVVEVDHQLIPLQLSTRLDGNGKLSFI
jgi:type VI secretion system protein